MREPGVFFLGALKLLCGSVHDQLWAVKIWLDIGPTRADIRTLARSRLQTCLGLPGTILLENDVKQSIHFFWNTWFFFVFVKARSWSGHIVDATDSPRFWTKKLAMSPGFPVRGCYGWYQIHTYSFRSFASKGFPDGYSTGCLRVSASAQKVPT